MSACVNTFKELVRFYFLSNSSSSLFWLFHLNEFEWPQLVRNAYTGDPPDCAAHDVSSIWRLMRDEWLLNQSELVAASYQINRTRRVTIHQAIINKIFPVATIAHEKMSSFKQFSTLHFLVHLRKPVFPSCLPNRAVPNIGKLLGSAPITPLCRQSNAYNKVCRLHTSTSFFKTKLVPSCAPRLSFWSTNSHDELEDVPFTPIG